MGRGKVDVKKLWSFFIKKIIICKIHEKLKLNTLKIYGKNYSPWQQQVATDRIELPDLSVYTNLKFDFKTSFTPFYAPTYLPTHNA